MKLRSRNIMSPCLPSKPVTCVIRDPASLTNWRNEMRNLCATAGPELIFSFKEFRINVKTLQIRSRDVVNCQAIEFPKTFFTCLRVPKDEMVEVVVAKEELMLALNENNESFRMYLEDNHLTVNGRILNTKVNRSSPSQSISSSLFRSYSLLHKKTPQSFSRIGARRHSVSPSEEPNQTTKLGVSVKVNQYKPLNIVSTQVKQAECNLTPPKTKSEIPIKTTNLFKPRNLLRNMDKAAMLENKIQKSANKKIKHWFPEIGKQFDIFKHFPGHRNVLANESINSSPKKKKFGIVNETIINHR